MGAHIVIEQTVQQDTQTISLEEYRKRRVRRRKRVAKRMEKRFPLFAVEFMQSEFPGYTWDVFEEDVKRKSKKRSTRKSKSPLKRQGRYPLMIKAIGKYQQTKDTKYLHQAQQLRNRLYCHFEVVFKLNAQRKVITFPSTTSVQFVQKIGEIKFSSWEELDAILEDKLKYAHLS